MILSRPTSPMMAVLTSFLLCSAVGCSGSSPEDDPEVPPVEDIDVDGDGYSTADGDCDDTNEAIHPGAEEVWYDGVDQDCDEADDFDADADGVLVDADCDDLDATSTVLAEDADCDGVLTADDCDDLEATSTILAEDGDCDGTPTAADCDDADPDSALVADDADCDGSPDDEDCDDTDPAVSPLAIDVPGDGIDNNCNGVIDGAIPSDSSWATVSGAGSGAHYNFAMSHCGGGDVDGDDLDDLWVGAPNNSNPYQGFSLMIPGSALAAGGAMTSAESAANVLSGATYDRAGQTLHCPGDLDGDGLPEVMVGTNYAQASQAYKVYLVWGDELAGQGTALLGAVSDTLAGPEHGFHIDGPSGPELVLMGGTLPQMKVVEVADLPLVESVVTVGQDWVDIDPSVYNSGAGDFDGDGLSDLALVWGSGVNIYLAVSRPTEGETLSIQEWDVRVTSTQMGDGFGGSSGPKVADLDGDGRDDLLVGASDNSTDSSGAIYIFLADTLMNASLGEVTTDDVDVLFDTNVANASAGTRLYIDSDLDGDGLLDLVVAGRTTPGTGGGVPQTLRVFFGHSLLSSPARDLLLPDASWTPSEDEPRNSLRPASAGDINGDGRDDLAVGNFSAGVVYVLTELIP